MKRPIDMNSNDIDINLSQGRLLSGSVELKIVLLSSKSWLCNCFSAQNKTWYVWPTEEGRKISGLLKSNFTSLNRFEMGTFLSYE